MLYVYVYTPIYLYSIYILDTFTWPTQDLVGDVKDVSHFYPDPWGIGSQWSDEHIFQIGWNHQPEDHKKCFFRGNYQWIFQVPVKGGIGII